MPYAETDFISREYNLTEGYCSDPFWNKRISLIANFDDKIFMCLESKIIFLDPRLTKTKTMF